MLADILLRLRLASQLSASRLPSERIEDCPNIVKCRQWVHEAEAQHLFAVMLRRQYKTHPIAESLHRPTIIVIWVPSISSKQDNGQLGLHNQLKILSALNLGNRGSRKIDRRLDPLLITPTAMDR